MFGYRVICNERQYDGTLDMKCCLVKQFYAIALFGRMRFQNKILEKHR